jgi:hypothetical protein
MGDPDRRAGATVDLGVSLHPKLAHWGLTRRADYARHVRVGLPATKRVKGEQNGWLLSLIVHIYVSETTQ